MGERRVRRNFCAKVTECLPPRLLTAISVAYFAFLGLAARTSINLLLKDLTFGITSTKPGVRCHLASSGSGFFVQNIVGCMLMAAIARHKKSMNEHLAVGLASGLCGSLTTFATWMGEEAKTIMNGYVFEAFVSVICMLCVSLSAYRFGHFVAGCGMGEDVRSFDEFCGLAHVCCIFQKKSYLEESSSECSTPDAELATDSKKMRVASDRSESDEVDSDEVVEEGVEDLDWGLAVDTTRSWREPEPPKDLKLNPRCELVIVATSAVCIALYIGLCARLGYDAGLLDLAYAPAGALVRWYLSLYNASASKICLGIPLMTLVANTLGVVCNSFPAVLEPRLDDHTGKIAIAAVSTGFAGCLSTVSTLISELRSDAIGGLRVRIVYFLLSFGLAMAIELPMLTALC